MGFEEREEVGIKEKARDSPGQLAQTEATRYTCSSTSSRAGAQVVSDSLS
jgi:hypothetical protein